MPLHNPFRTLKAIRIVAMVFPPLGLLFLWLSPEIRVGRKVLGTIYLPLYTIVYVAAVLATLYFGFGIDFIEWRGGLIPVITFSKTVPDYDKLESDRARQHAAPVIISKTANATPYWTGFRGPERNGIYAEKPILTHWPTNGLKRLWQQPVGGGYSSFCIAEGLAFTIEQRRLNEVVVAYDAATGREVWNHPWPARFFELVSGEGPRSTPTYHAGRLYVQGATGELRCLEAATGKKLWHHDMIAENSASVPTYGVSASPLIVDNKLIAMAGGTNGNSVVAYDLSTGAVVWKTLNDPQAYVSPMLVTLFGKRQILVVTTRRAVGLSADDGQLLWEFPWQVTNDNTIAQPLILGTNRFFLSAGYGKGSVAVDIVDSGGHWVTREAWRNKALKNKFSSSVLWNGFIYGLDEDTLTCLDASSGQRKWRDGRYGYGQLLLADGHLIVLAADGQLALVKAEPDRWREVARFHAVSGKTWNYPAIADGKIFVRNLAEMACFDISVSATGIDAR